MSGYRSIVQAKRSSSARSVSPWLRLLVHRHDQVEPWALSDSLLGYQQAARQGPPFSSWGAPLKLPARSRLLAALEGLSDVDWVEVSVSLGGPQGDFLPLQLGPLDSIRAKMQVAGGTEEWVLSLRGRSWAKVLTDTTVSTWQRLSSAGLDAGSIFSPEEANEISSRLAAVASSGERTADLLADLLTYILRFQWALPPSLLARGFGTGRTLADVMWFLGPPAVSTGGASEVDGVVWRGLSMIGGVRGTLWQLLSSFQNDPALVELWPGWTLEEASCRLRPVLIFRKRPFSAEDWGNLSRQQIALDRVSALDLGKGGLERFNVALVSPAIAGADFESAVLATADGPCFVSTEEQRGILRHGTRGWFLTDSQSPPDLDPLEQAQRLTRWLVAAYLETPDLLNGSIEVVGQALPPTVLGNRVALRDTSGRDLLEFYCEGLDTSFEVGDDGERTWQQVLSVTRGRALENA